MSDTKTAPAPHLEKFDATLIGVAVIVILGSFMSLLDSTIVNVAIDTLSTAFDATLSQVQWVTTGYLLALAAVIPLTGGPRTGSAPSGCTWSPSRCSLPPLSWPGWLGTWSR